jgi:hypothetical protein
MITDTTNYSMGHNKSNVNGKLQNMLYAMQRGRKVPVEFVRNYAQGKMSNAKYTGHSSVFSKCNRNMKYIIWGP